MLERMLESSGVQMLLANLIKGAAPELIETVEQFTQSVIALKAQLDRVEKQQRKILAIIEQKGSEHGDVRGRNSNIEGSINSAGNESS